MLDIILKCRYIIVLIVMVISFSCSTSKKPVSQNGGPQNGFGLSNELFMKWGVRDSSLVHEKPDNSGDGIFGRKVIYRNLKKIKYIESKSGSAVFKICINRSGIVTYAELLSSESTIHDTKILSMYMDVARGYKFQATDSAPLEQCGKLAFIINNTIKLNLHSY